MTTPLNEVESERRDRPFIVAIPEEVMFWEGGNLALQGEPRFDPSSFRYRLLFGLGFGWLLRRALPLICLSTEVGRYSLTVCATCRGRSVNDPREASKRSSQSLAPSR
jgi:hypothetical protein